MSHIISVEIDSETAKEFIEHTAFDADIPVSLKTEIAEAMVRALDEDDAEDE